MVNKYSDNIFFTEDEERALNSLIKDFKIEIPEDGVTRNKDPFTDEIEIVQQVRLNDLETKQVQNVTKIENRIADQRRNFAKTGKYLIFGDEKKLGHFLRTGFFEFGGER